MKFSSAWAISVLLFPYESIAFVPSIENGKVGPYLTDQRARSKLKNSSVSAGVSSDDKESFLLSLEDRSRLNMATNERTTLLNEMIQNRREGAVTNAPSLLDAAAASIESPGRWNSFAPVAPGCWKVVYAPHMTTMEKLAGGSFQVEYVLKKDGTMESHALYDFPIVGVGYLSVSGTYGSVDDKTCRVDFDEAWIRSFKKREEGKNLGPYRTIQDVPDSLVKSIIRGLGQLFFIDGVSVFPISFLDDDLIVFDFELLGTRICGRKLASKEDSLFPIEK